MKNSDLKEIIQELVLMKELIFVRKEDDSKGNLEITKKFYKKMNSEILAVTPAILEAMKKRMQSNPI